MPYRETIRGRAEAQGKHKKQTGGHGQFGDCRIRMEPLPRGSGIVFENQIFGGSIPRQFVPAVEKGIHESAAPGISCGVSRGGLQGDGDDGSYHDVDSSEMSFKLAGRLAFRKCMEQAKPTLLEPIMRVEIEAPDEFAGALMADLNGRRGRVQGMETEGSGTVVRAEVPDGRDAELRSGFDVNYSGSRHASDGYGPLRPGSATDLREDCSDGPQASWRRDGGLKLTLCRDNPSCNGISSVRS